MNDLVFVSYCFGERYEKQQDRLLQSIRALYPDNVCLFSRNEPRPQGARPMEESLYGFKPHAVNAALNMGYKKIVWFDTPIVLTARLDEYAEMVKQYGVIAVQDDNKLTGCTSDRAVRYFRITRDYLVDKHLVGGSFYYFDFDLPKCREIFNKWIRAEKMGIFGSAQEEASEQLQGHRLDETVLSLCLYTSGSSPYRDPRYNSQTNPTMVKQHFK